MTHAASKDARFIVYKGRKYDMSRWMARHPGGSQVVQWFLGKDATVPMHMFHDMENPTVVKWLPKFDRGPAPHAESSSFDRDYLALEAKFRDLGWFRPSVLWFIYKTAQVFGFLAASLIVTNPWFKGILLGFFVHQAAFLAHDTCHDAAFPRRYRRWMGWFYGSVCFGLNHGKWTREHNGHHLINNRPLDDPQINNMPDILYSYREVESFEQRKRALSMREKRMMGYAHVWLIPVLLFYGRANAMRAEVRRARRAIRNSVDSELVAEAKLYLLGLIAHVFIMALVVASGFLQEGGGEPLEYVLVVPLVALALSGILHLQLILSHGYRPRLYEGEQERLGMRIQIISNQNISCSFLTAWFHGGLENHIEHHLFPRIPRHNLPKLRPYVRALCEKHHLEYNTAPFLTCVWRFLCSLKNQSAPLRAELGRGGASSSRPPSDSVHDLEKAS